MSDVEIRPILGESGEAIGQEYWRDGVLVQQEWHGPGRQFLGELPGGNYYGRDGDGVPYWGGEALEHVADAAGALVMYNLLSEHPLVDQPAEASAAKPGRPRRNEATDRPWVVRDVPADTRRKVGVFAMQHDLTRAQAITFLIDTALRSLESE